MINKTKKTFRRKNYKIILVFFILFFIFATVKSASADLEGAIVGGIGSGVQLIVGWIAFILVSVLGLITTLMIKMLVSVAQFNDIINVPIVVQGWVIVRDLCNMFFVLALLVIAFATILKLENYSAKRLLPKLLIMAVVINFSKMIFGLMIDASQVVMLTFVNGFASGGGHLTELFNMDKYLSVNVSGDSISSDSLTPWATVVSIIAALFAAIMTLIVVAVILAVLIMRIIFLWIYTMLSPFAFLGFAFPPIQGYTRQIWEDFVKQLIVGPVLAFFLWLALTTAQANSDALRGTDGLTTTGSSGELCTGASVFFCEGDFIKYILVIGLLLGGLKFAQQMGGDIAKVAGKAEGWAKKGVGKITRDPVVSASKGTAKWAGRTALGGVSRGSLALSHALGRKDSDGKVKRGMIGELAHNWRGDLVKSRDGALKKKRLATLKKIGMSSEETFESVEEIAKSKGGRAVKGASGLAVAGTGLVSGDPALIKAGVATATASVISLMGGVLKGFADKNEKTRKDKLDVKKKGTKKWQNSAEEGIERIRAGKMEVLDMKKNYDPTDKKEEEKKIYEKNVENLDKQKENELKNIGRELTFHIISDTEHETKKNEINNNYESGKEKAREMYDTRKDKADVRPMTDKEYKDRKKEIDNDFSRRMLSVSGTATKINKKAEKEIEGTKTFIDKIMKNRDPNKVTIAAAQEGSKNAINAGKKVNALKEGDNITDMSANAFYSSSGQNAAQKRFFDKLTAGNDDSKKAIDNITKTLRAIAKGEVIAEKAQTAAILSLKKGIAAYKKGGGDVVNLEQVIVEANQIPNSKDITHKDVNTTVEEFEDRVIE